MSPALRDDVLYFASINSDTVLVMKADGSDARKEGNLMKMYTSKVAGDSYTEKAQVKTFSVEGKHISNPSFSEDGKKFFYTICDGNLLYPTAIFTKAISPVWNGAQAKNWMKK